MSLFSLLPMLLAQTCRGSLYYDHGDCQVPIYFEASWLPQTDSEVLPTSKLTYSLTLNSRTKDGGCYCYLHFISKLLDN